MDITIKAGAHLFKELIKLSGIGPSNRKNKARNNDNDNKIMSISISRAILIFLYISLNTYTLYLTSIRHNQSLLDNQCLLHDYSA